MIGLDEIYDSIGKNFFRALIVYLPKNVINLIADKSKKEDLKKIANKVFVIEKSSHNYFIEKGQHCVIHVLPKTVLLDDNIYKLIQYKEEHKEELFKFILEKYMEQLSVYLYVCKWMRDNVSDDIIELEGEVYEAFKLQYDIFNRHQEQVKKRFNVSSTEMISNNLSNIREEGFKTLSHQFKDVRLKTIFKGGLTANDLKIKRKLDLQDLKKKTGEIADALILGQVFGIKIDNSNQKLND